ncbi:hypothetical protein [Serratia marcescens]|nr:hypothetical protein [Serratia marcescens]MDX7487232.1 hypothetical protein [Serratia marcescens]
MKGSNILNWTRRATWCAVFAFCVSFWLGVFGLGLIAIAEWAQ